MTCEECLSELATGSLREMPPDSSVMLHCATCPDCSRLTTLLREREYNAANVLNNLPPMSNPITVAETSVRTAHRRRTGRVVVMLSGAALVVTIWIAAATTIIPALNRADAGTASTLRTETIPLRCLSPQQAADIIDPYIRTRGSIYYVPASGISAITVRGNASQLAKSRELIATFEEDPAAACRNTPAAMARKMLEDQVFRDAAPVIAGKATTAPKK
jgi:type II secretory pathway component GspD/PulD (secretin)